MTSDKFTVTLKDGRVCKLSNVDTFKFVEKFVKEKDVEDSTILEVFNIDENLFDLAYKDEYLEDLGIWIAEQDSTTKNLLTGYKHLTIDFNIKERKCRIMQYCTEIIVSNKGAESFVDGEYKRYSVPTNQTSFDAIFSDL